MIYLSNNDKERINENLKDAIKNSLLKNFKNRNGREIDSIEYINILKYEIDGENSNRNKLIIHNIFATARIWVKFVEDSTSSDNIQLRNSKPIEFIYDEEIQGFKIVDQEIIFFDNTTF